MQEGNLAFKAGEFERAAACYTAVIDSDSSLQKERITCLVNRAAARLKQPGDAKVLLALADAKQALTLEPTHVKGHFRKGQALQRLRRPGEAARSFISVLELTPADAAAQAALCCVLGVDA